MTRRREDIDEQVGTVVATLRNGVERHPSARRIAAYHRGELSTPDVEQLRDHLAMCPECADLLLDFAGFSEQPATGAAEWWKTRKEAVWGVLRSRLGKRT
ncbi:MAG: zf-HC2 domain-containing protein [bacterium]|nr:zf-HC2 domain-containing protein [bacterium]